MNLPTALYRYDGSFEGLLSAIFETYLRKIEPHGFQPEDRPAVDLFSEPLHVETNPAHAERVKKGIIAKTSKETFHLLYRCFLSEQADAELLIYRFIRLAMASKQDISENYAEAVVLRLHEINKKMAREIHRMHAFVRFLHLQNGGWLALIEPDFNVLPLAWQHFQERYPAQSWVIYDVRRRFGVSQQEGKAHYFFLDSAQHEDLKRMAKQEMNTDEQAFQLLWQRYFESVNIPARKNPKLHLQHVPKRYWKYLTEKIAW